MMPFTAVLPSCREVPRPITVEHNVLLCSPAEDMVYTAGEFCVIPVNVSASTVCQLEIADDGTYGERHCLLACMSC
jgi:hypothetical protein